MLFAAEVYMKGTQLSPYAFSAPTGRGECLILAEQNVGIVTFQFRCPFIVSVSIMPRYLIASDCAGAGTANYVMLSPQIQFFIWQWVAVEVRPLQCYRHLFFGGFGIREASTGAIPPQELQQRHGCSLERPFTFLGTHIFTDCASGRCHGHCEVHKKECAPTDLGPYDSEAGTLSWFQLSVYSGHLRSGPSVHSIFGLEPEAA